MHIKYIDDLKLNCSKGQNVDLKQLVRNNRIINNTLSPILF